MTEGYLLDTNIVSETRKVHADEGVMAFLGSQPSSALFLSVLTIGELHEGVAIKPRTDRIGANKIEAWVDTIETSFGDHILPVDNDVARRWAELAADRSRPVIDTMIAATALVHRLPLVTRNIADVSGHGMAVHNPFNEPHVGP